MPTELMTYIHEIFTPQLGTMLYHNDLPRRWRVTIEAYREKRDAAVAALRERIESSRTLEPAARAAGLSAFAREQAPVLAALEAEAEQIRDRLTHGDFFTQGSDWNDSRRWRLGDDMQWESNVDEFRVMRAAVYYQRGLTLDQRNLLREMALELGTLLRNPLGEIDLRGPPPAFAFSPMPASLRLPADLPEALVAKMNRYRDEKEVLKRELRDELYARDRTWFASRRISALRALGERRAPRFAALEDLAESIRRDLQDVPGITPRINTPGLPAELHARIEHYLEAKASLQDALTQKLNALRAELPFDRIEFARVGGGYGIVHVPSRQTRKTDRARTVASELNEFNTAQVAKFAELAREKA
ncbi:MAG TPA: hypothetical protein VHF69_12470, partial [Candidatus Synoicihabitans sp.]|nr:hypothetical protein [Candidatus Synoicihabitans sp.]